MIKNGKGKMKSSSEEKEIKRLREALQKAVNNENAPESLYEKIRKMIRE